MSSYREIRCRCGNLLQCPLKIRVVADLRGEARRAAGLLKLGEEGFEIVSAVWRIIVVGVGVEGISERHEGSLVNLL